MNVKVKLILNNLSYSLTSNLLSLFISSLVIVIVPKLIGISDYGYWQLYIFYTLYLGFFNVGWVEGIYLRYGGEEYNSLKKSLFATQFFSFFMYIFFISIFIMGYSYLFINEVDRKFIFLMVSFCLIISVPRGFLLYILQATNRIKEYSKVTLLDRIIYCVVILFLLILGIKDYRQLIYADLIGKIITFLITIYACKEIVFHRFISLKENLKELKINITVGIKLMFANIASMLIIGVVRFAIVRFWNVETFGKVSLTLSISNLMMLFINALGIIMFPILRKTDEKKLPGIYLALRNFLMIILLGLLMIYFPLKLVLGIWLPSYSESLTYMAILFPMVIFEGKMSLLINTYLKTLRKEKFMLNINIISLGFSIFLTATTTLLLKNLDLAVLSILIVLAFRAVAAEIFLSRVLNIKLTKDIVLELLMTFVFVFISWFSHSWLSLFEYFVFYIIYLILKKREVVHSVQRFKVLLKSTRNKF